MSFHPLFRAVAPFALAAVALGMTACAPDESEPAPTVTVTAPAEEPTSMEPTTETSEPVAETSEPGTSKSMVSETPEDTMGPNDESGVVDITVTGDEGILALQHAGTTPSASAGPASQKLIVGPGGCFSLVNEGQPQLVVFPEDATFVLQEGKPSATVDGTEYFVGQQFSVATTAVSKENTAGIPQRCAEGSDATVLVVN